MKIEQKCTKYPTKKRQTRTGFQRFSGSKLVLNRWKPFRGPQLLREWHYYYENGSTGDGKIIETCSTVFNGNLYQFTTEKSLKTVVRFPIILQSPVLEMAK
jgi:hypothetical protein